MDSDTEQGPELSSQLITDLFALIDRTQSGTINARSLLYAVTSGRIVGKWKKFFEGSFLLQLFLKPEAWREADKQFRSMVNHKKGCDLNRFANILRVQEAIFQAEKEEVPIPTIEMTNEESTKQALLSVLFDQIDDGQSGYISLDECIDAIASERLSNCLRKCTTTEYKASLVLSQAWREKLQQVCSKTDIPNFMSYVEFCDFLRPFLFILDVDLDEELESPTIRLSKENADDLLHLKPLAAREKETRQASTTVQKIVRGHQSRRRHRAWLIEDHFDQLYNYICSAYPESHDEPDDHVQKIAVLKAVRTCKPVRVYIKQLTKDIPGVQRLFKPIRWFPVFRDVNGYLSETVSRKQFIVFFSKLSVRKHEFTAAELNTAMYKPQQRLLLEVFQDLDHEKRGYIDKQVILDALCTKADLIERIPSVYERGPGFGKLLLPATYREVFADMDPERTGKLSFQNFYNYYEHVVQEKENKLKQKEQKQQEQIEQIQNGKYAKVKSKVVQQLEWNQMALEKRIRDRERMKHKKKAKKSKRKDIATEEIDDLAVCLDSKNRDVSDASYTNQSMGERRRKASNIDEIWSELEADKEKEARDSKLFLEKEGTDLWLLQEDDLWDFSKPVDMKKIMSEVKLDRDEDAEYTSLFDLKRKSKTGDEEGKVATKRTSKSSALPNINQGKKKKGGKKNRFGFGTKSNRTKQKYAVK